MSEREIEGEICEVGRSCLLPTRGTINNTSKHRRARERERERVNVQISTCKNSYYHSHTPAVFFSPKNDITNMLFIPLSPRRSNIYRQKIVNFFLSLDINFVNGPI